MRIKLALTLAAAISAALTLTAHAQTTYYVNGACGDDLWTGTSPVCQAPDGPKKTIQAGIDASVAADTVIVADGTYTGAGNRDMDFGGKAITVRSANGAAVCIIDIQGSAGDPHRAFHFHSGETPASAVEGFTITNGVMDAGGAMLIENGSAPTIISCSFEGNMANPAVGPAGGGAVAIFDSQPTFAECDFTGNSMVNTVSSTAGGAIFLCPPV